VPTPKDTITYIPGKLAKTSGQELSDSLVVRLTEKFPEAVKANVPFGNSFADLVIERPDRVIIAELKTGDPELPLPSSTYPQMGLFIEQARRRYPDREIVPLVLTNYGISESDKKVFSEEGVQILSVGSRSIDAIVDIVVREVGLSPQNPASSQRPIRHDLETT
jgi:hypothetical protein